MCVIKLLLNCCNIVTAELYIQHVHQTVFLIKDSYPNTLQSSEVKVFLQRFLNPLNLILKFSFNF